MGIIEITAYITGLAYISNHFMGLPFSLLVILWAYGADFSLYYMSDAHIMGLLSNFLAEHGVYFFGSHPSLFRQFSQGNLLKSCI